MGIPYWSRFCMRVIGRCAWGIHIWNFKTLACTVHKIWHASDFVHIFSKGHNSRKGDNLDKKKNVHQLCFNEESIYRRLSLSQSPGDQTKYFELSVVWDSQFVTSFTLYMYTDCLDHYDYNLHVYVFGNDILEFKFPLTELFISHTNFEMAATEIKECWWLLTSKNAVKHCSVTKVTKAPLRTLWV